MKVNFDPERGLELRFDVNEARKLAQDLIQHSEAANSQVLNLAYALREAGYQLKNHFRQPPHAWDERHQPWPSTRTH